MLVAALMERRIRAYFDACNAADYHAICGHFVPQGAVHYFPPGMYQGPFVGAETIAERWVKAVGELGSVWTVDQVVTDPSGARAIVEWSHFKTFTRTLLRGDEWYVFDRDTGLIREIRAYYASPHDSNVVANQLQGFDYQARGYPLRPPFYRDAGPSSGDA